MFGLFQGYRISSCFNRVSFISKFHINVNQHCVINKNRSFSTEVKNNKQHTTVALGYENFCRFFFVSNFLTSLRGICNEKKNIFTDVSKAKNPFSKRKTKTLWKNKRNQFIHNLNLII